MPYASVYPLVSARAVARPYTYEVPEDVRKGAVVSVPFGAARRRGVVVELEQSPPPGVDALPVAALLGAVPAPLKGAALAKPLHRIDPSRRTACASSSRAAQD